MTTIPHGTLSFEQVTAALSNAGAWGVAHALELLVKQAEKEGEPQATIARRVIAQQVDRARRGNAVDLPGKFEAVAGNVQEAARILGRPARKRRTDKGRQRPTREVTKPTKEVVEAGGKAKRGRGRDALAVLELAMEEGALMQAAKVGKSFGITLYKGKTTVAGAGESLKEAISSVATKFMNR